MTADPLSPRPSPQALVICDAGHVDPATGKPYLLGRFDQVRGESFPLKQPQLTVYCSFTDARRRRAGSGCCTARGVGWKRRQARGAVGS